MRDVLLRIHRRVRDFEPYVTLLGATGLFSWIAKRGSVLGVDTWEEAVFLGVFAGAALMAILAGALAGYRYFKPLATSRAASQPEVATAALTYNDTEIWAALEALTAKLDTSVEALTSEMQALRQSSTMVRFLALKERIDGAEQAIDLLEQLSEIPPCEGQRDGEGMNGFTRRSHAHSDQVRHLQQEIKAIIETCKLITPEHMQKIDAGIESHYKGDALSVDWDGSDKGLYPTKQAKRDAVIKQKKWEAYRGQIAVFKRESCEILSDLRKQLVEATTKE